MLKKIIKDAALKCGVEIKRARPAPPEASGSVVSLRPEGASKGTMLLSYIMEPFLLTEGEPVPNTHTHYGESLEMAKVFLGLGYGVDSIDYRNRAFIPKKNYAVFVGARTNFARIAASLNSDCIKIVHMDTAHWLFNNAASYRRGLELQRRRGVTVDSLRIIEFNLGIEYADFATVLGNEFTLGTYAYAGKPLFRIDVPSCAVYPWPEDKDYDACRKNFLWLGSSGLVHKGLDLVLEAFAGMPDYHLYVCGPVTDEKHFERAFYRELYLTPNIHTVGWVDVAQARFRAVLDTCIGVVYPSCSEGQAGSVVTCMHAGVIPIVSYETGIDVEDFGIILGESSVEEIRKAVAALAGCSGSELGSRARATWEYARTHCTAERYARSYRQIVERIMGGHRSSAGEG